MLAPSDLKKIYGAESEEIALRNLESMQEDLKKYGAVLDSWPKTRLSSFSTFHG